MKSIFPFLILLPLISCGPAKRPDTTADWDGVAAPLISASSEKNLAALPLKGKAGNNQRYWSGDYWALNKGLINYRWYSGEHGFDLNSPGMTESSQMSQSELSALSPAEKFDLLRGRYDYPLKSEVARLANPNAEYWEGICHGWAPAAINHNEPMPKRLKNPQGIVIPFGSTDIKALISYYYANVYKAPNTFQVGRRCPQSGGLLNFNRDCRNDLNAGTFHIILGNNLGIKKKSFVADIKRFDEVWNHPYVDYTSEIIDRRGPGWPFPKPGVKEIVRVRTVVSYVDESETNTWEPVLGSSIQKNGQKTYEYDLHLDNKGVIIGGSWESKERPDFLWSVGRPPKFEGNLSGLAGLLND